MSEKKSDYILIRQQLGKNPEQQIFEKLRDAVHHNNSIGCRTSAALSELNGTNVKDSVVGPNFIGILDSSGQIYRFSVEQKSVCKASKEESTANPSNTDVRPPLAPVANGTNGIKTRRILLSAASLLRESRGILIERGGGRPMIAASSVPEDLIVQTQAVLQGKSREVIVRELQRTNLNVNEAVNNLLSRDDDDEDGEDTGEVMIPEELLSLLDPSSAANHAIVEASEGYNPDALEYIFSGRDRLRGKPETKEKEKKPKEDATEKPVRTGNDITIGDGIERYSLEDGYAPGGRRFVAIAATGSELLALSEDGVLYGWKWDEKHGDKNPHSIAKSLLPEVPVNDKIVTLSACSLRVAVTTKNEVITSWLDHYAIGLRACQATAVKPVRVVSDIVELSVSNHIAVARSKTGDLYWCGLYPFSDRPRIWEKERAKSKKHVTFSTEISDITEGSEVRTKCSPVYAAGSVAVNLSLEKPMVGVLMESVWSISEMCRFRVMDPAVYDRDLPGDTPEGSGRKRRASQDVFESSTSREETWDVGTLVWIHEQQNQATCIVKIVDGAYVGVEYIPSCSDMTFASSQSGNLSSKEGDVVNSTGKMRLMRKDDLCLTNRMESIRSPKVLQSEPTKVSLPSSNSRKVLSVIADSNGLRVLVEKRGRLFIARISVSGKIGSERLLHIHPASLYGPSGIGPQLLNYGEDSILIIKDGNGSLIPLVRDAIMGFREPSPLHLPPLKHFSMGVWNTNSTVSQSSKLEVVKSVTMVAFVSPILSQEQQLPSLVQSVLWCDSNGVESLLDLFEKQDSSFLKKEVLHARTDCGGSVLHCAIRLAVAKNNKPPAHPIPSCKDQDMPALENDSSRFGSPVEDEKLRQKGALAIVKIIVEHPVVQPLLENLLSIRDASGLTPFQSAVNSRAYGAALSIWAAIKTCIGSDMDSERLMRLIFPSGSRPDDSPVFLLCYNDTCSFSWTGENHINQDIFECRTCGLTGTLCCCSECALSCHRNHDYKWKRTSPTAYCDCWNQCRCKALILGNQEKREQLFRQMLNHTSLHELVNNRGEHVLLYLARTIGRQKAEQGNMRRRRFIESENPNVPHHNLDPPQFAKFALIASLSEWKVIRGAIRVGLREPDKLRAVYEEVLIAHSQHGVTHMDKLVFALFTKCGKQVISTLLPTVIAAANEEKSTRDPLVDKMLSRFVRSIIRLYLMCMLLSPIAAATAISGKTFPDAASPIAEKKAYISIGGLLSIARGEQKDTKTHAISSLISRFRAVLFDLSSFAVQQALNISESLILPVRMGICRPTMLLHLPNNMDPIEYIEKYLNNEADLTSVLARGEEKEKPSQQRKKKVSNKNDKNRIEKSSQESGSDSDSGDGHSSRRHNSQSGVEDATESSQAPISRRNSGISELYMNDDELDSGDSSSPSDSGEETEEDFVMIDNDDEAEYDYRDTVNEILEIDSAQSAADVDVEVEAGSQYNEESEAVLEDIFRNDDDESREEAENREPNSDETQGLAFNNPSPVSEPQSENDVSNDVRELNDSELMARRYIELRRSLNWLRPGRRSSEEEDGWEDLDIVRRERVPPNDRVATNTTPASPRAPPSSSVNTGTAATPSEQPGTPIESSSAQTAYQMCRMFNYTVRLIADLMHVVDEESNDPLESRFKLNISEATLRFVMASVLTCLEATWIWLTAMMDRLESQLLFQNGILMATNLTEPRVPPNQAKKKDHKKDKGAEGHTRRETMEYLLTSMRTCSQEAGDNFPIIDLELMHNLAFVFDGFMVYKGALEQGKKVMRERNRQQTSSPKSIEPQRLKEFFERSNPRAFCGSLTSNAWDTLSANSSVIPLALNSGLLTPWSENDALYAPYSQLTNWSSYEKAAQRLGLDAEGMSNSLYNFNDSDLPTSLSDLSDDEDEEMPEDDKVDSFENPKGMEPITVSEMKEYLRDSIHKPGNYVLSRWKNVLYVMAKDCVSDITDAFGGEDGNSFLVTTVARPSVRFTRFKKIIDQYRAAQTRDLTMEVHRDPNQLIRDTIFDLNQTYVRRINLPKPKEDNTTPMSCGKVKIKFHNEPGEGSGVARSYFCALAEALQNNQKLPFEEYGWSGSDDYLFGGVRPSGNKGNTTRDNERSSHSRIAVIRERGTSTIMGRKRSKKRQQLSAAARPYTVEDTSKIDPNWEQLCAGLDRSGGDDNAREKKFIADALYMKVEQLRSSSAASRITGMLVDLPTSVVINILGNGALLKQYVDDAVALMLQSGIPSDLALLSSNQKKNTDTSDHPASDEASLFVRTSKSGGYMPNPGNLSPIRLNVFRNVGRMIGLCLLQGELFPLKLSRHVVKYLLGKPLNWLDLQFFDSELFESLRKGLLDNNTDEYFESMQLTFAANVPSSDSSQVVVTVELKANGANISVTPENVLEYIYRFVEVRMLSADCIKCLQAMQRGIFDSLPFDSLDLLNPDDLRLLMCGAEQLNVSFLQEITTFSDESHSDKDTIDKFKEWFWSVVDDLSDADKQDLIFFWTGSPSLPTIEEVVHPQPTVVIRPRDDLYFPTANTCISRLYVPLYSSKKVLKGKISLAIKEKNFGFV